MQLVLLLHPTEIRVPLSVLVKVDVYSWHFVDVVTRGFCHAALVPYHRQIAVGWNKNKTLLKRSLAVLIIYKLFYSILDINFPPALCIDLVVLCWLSFPLNITSRCHNEPHHRTHFTSGQRLISPSRKRSLK
jgi:hypothetical protein